MQNHFNVYGKMFSSVFEIASWYQNSNDFDNVFIINTKRIIALNFFGSDIYRQDFAKVSDPEIFL